MTLSALLGSMAFEIKQRKFVQSDPNRGHNYEQIHMSCKRDVIKGKMRERKTTNPQDGYTCPMYSCNPVSLITYHWLTNITATIYKQGEVLRENLWQLHSKDNCSTNGNRFERLWKEELCRRGGGSASVLRILWLGMWRNILACGLLSTVAVSCGLIVPTVLVRGILTYNKNDDERLWYGLTLVLAYFITETTHRVLYAGSWVLAYQSGVRVCSGLGDMLYNKLLRTHTLRDKSVGQMINIFMNDLSRIFVSVTYLPYILHGPITAIVTIIYCVMYLGPWALVGATVIFAYYPYQMLLSKANMLLRRKAVIITDSRINLMTEILTNIKLIKLYCWEKAFTRTITGLRMREFRILRKSGFVVTLSNAVAPLVPVLAGVCMFLAHILSGNNLDATQPFVVLSVLYLVRPKMSMASLMFKSFSDSLVALKRIKAVLIMKETPPISSFPKPSDPSVAMEINNGTFIWETFPILTNHELGSKSCLTNGKCSDKMLHSDWRDSSPLLEKESLLQQEPDVSVGALQDINIKIKKGQLCGVCGSVGSGKSSLISAILGQMEIIKGSVSISGRVAYVPQQAWILNATLRDNILFGLPFKGERYRQVLNHCCLAPDIDLLPAGDQTEIGERGITLSGGQKQRISLARALYSDYEIYLLDDPMSAVDAHVGQHLFENCIQKALREKTVLLVTHQLQYLSQCDHILYMRSGEVVGSDTHSNLMEKNSEYSLLISTYTDTDNNKDNTTMYSGFSISTMQQNNAINKPPTRKISTERRNPILYKKQPRHGMESEMTDKGSLSFSTYLAYARAAGGYVCYTFVLMTFLLPVGCSAFNNWWLSHWINQGDGTDDKMAGNDTVLPSGGDTHAASLGANPHFYYYISVYIISAVCIMLCFVLRGAVYVGTGLKASRNLHNTVFSKVMRCPMSFYDTTPIGRTIDRFAKDMDNVDDKLPQSIGSFISNLCSCIVPVTIICIVFPWFLVAMVPIGLVFYMQFRLSHVVLREVKRVDNLTRSPVSSCLTTTLQGLSMIHAYSKQHEFRNRFRELFETNMAAVQLFYCCNKWLTSRLNVITTTMTTITALFVVYTKGQIPTSFAGLALVYASRITGLVQCAVRFGSETEALFTSVERIRHYIENVSSEASLVVEGCRPPPKWPQGGAIRFRNYSLRYRPQLPLVLNNINCDIRPEEKIGIVGRTGSGKSSLGVGIFRLVEPDSGTIEIDGVNIMTIGLSDLRTKLFIIPQDPVLFAGSIRYNLDPLSQYGDYEIWLALSSCHIKEKVESLPGGLEALVGESGENFSVGQRQLICLARAILRNAKILILDEATAAIDTETDVQIQTTIKEAFTHCTMLTIAHRLNTVLNYDRIMVLQAGQIAEFDEPAVLLDRPDSHLRALVKAAELSQNSS